MDVKTEATIDDLYRVGEDVKAELVNGEIVTMSPAGGRHNKAIGAIYVKLWQYEQATGRGDAYLDNTAFIVDLPHRKSFSPDVAYSFGPGSIGFLEGAPAFAVEVRSPSNRGPAGERKSAAKRADYFAAGTLVVWDVDLDGPDVVRSYRSDAPDSPTIFRRGDQAHAEPAVPGWSMAVNDLPR